MTKPSPRLAGPLLALVLSGAYFALWRPARTWLAHGVVAPALSAVRTDRARCFLIAPGGRTVGVRRRPACPALDDEADVPSFPAPAGFRFLLPGLFLIGVFPYRRYWWWLFLTHLALGALSLGLLAIGLAWSSWGFAAHRFVQVYLVAAVSIGAPALLLFRRASEIPHQVGNDTSERGFFVV